MKQLIEQLKKNEFQSVYLFYGVEVFLLDTYVKRFLNKIFDGAERTLNLDRFQSENLDLDRLQMSIQTLPFLAKHRVIIIERTDLFKKNKAAAEKVLAALKKQIPDNIVFLIESEIDKRSALYKYVHKQGTVAEFSYLNEPELVAFIQSQLKKEQILIAAADARYLIQNVGFELQILNSEIDKLISYCYETKKVTKEVIDTITTKHLESKIFELVDAIGHRNREQALRLYYDMMALKEPEIRVHFMIARQMMLLYKTKLMRNANLNSAKIAAELKIPPFIVKKLESQCYHFESGQLGQFIHQLVQIEYEYKTGVMDLSAGLEVFIAGTAV